MDEICAAECCMLGFFCGECCLYMDDSTEEDHRRSIHDHGIIVTYVYVEPVVVNPSSLTANAPAAAYVPDKIGGQYQPLPQTLADATYLPTPTSLLPSAQQVNAPSKV